MKPAWILPDRDQMGTVFVDQEGGVKPLHEAIDLSALPRALTLGIPEELFCARRTQPVCFLQFARLKMGEGLFAASLEAGKDISGRTVVISLIVQLKEKDYLRLDNIELPASEPEYSRLLLQELMKQDCERGSALNALRSAVVSFPNLRTFASANLKRSANRPDWMKKKTFGAGLSNAS